MDCSVMTHDLARMRRAECIRKVGAVRPKAGRTIIGSWNGKRKDRLFLVVLDASCPRRRCRTSSWMFLSTWSAGYFGCRHWPAHWNSAGNRVGEVGARVIRVVAELAVRQRGEICIPRSFGSSLSRR